MSREMTFKVLDDVERGCTSQMVELEEIAKIVHSHIVCYTAVFSVVTQREERCVTTLKTAV